MVEDQVVVVTALLSGLGVLGVGLIAMNRALHQHLLATYLLVLSFTYLLFMPAYSILTSPRKVHLMDEYGLHMLYTVLLYGVPLLGLYLLLVRILQPFVSRQATADQDWWPRTRLFTVGVMAFSAVYLFIAVKNDLVFSRIGAGALLEKYARMPAAEFFLFRSFQELFFPVLIVGIYFAFKLRSNALRNPLLFMAGAFFITNVLNSRISVINLFVVGILFALMSAGSQVKRLTRLLIPALLAAGLSANFVVAARSSITMHGDVDISRALELSTGFQLFSDSQGAERIDCTNVQALLTKGMQREGPMYGGAWANYYWAVIGRYTDPQGFQTFKMTQKTASKTILLAHYLNWNVTDYVTCSVTDLYANFGPAGYLMLAVLYALALAAAWAVFAQPGATLWVIPLAIILARMISFDREGGDVLFGWIQFLPLYIVYTAAMLLVFSSRRGAPHRRPAPTAMPERYV